MDPRLEQLFRRQLTAGLPDLAGAEGSATIPIADDLLNQVVASVLPPGGLVSGVTLQTHAGDRLTARITVSKPRFLPPVPVTVAIERQPSLADSPEIVLKLTGAAGLLAFAGTTVGVSPALPPGVTLEGERIRVNVRTVLQRGGLDALLAHLEELYVTTRDGALVLSFRFRVRP